MDDPRRLAHKPKLWPTRRRYWTTRHDIPICPELYIWTVFNPDGPHISGAEWYTVCSLLRTLFENVRTVWLLMEYEYQPVLAFPDRVWYGF